MHHFGEDMTTGVVIGDRFRIEARHHTNNTVVEMTGPITGVLTNPNETINQDFIENLAREFAHFLRINLDASPTATLSM